MGYGNLRFQLLHVLAVGPRISKTLDDIVQLGLFLSGPEFGLVVFRGRWVNYPLLPHRIGVALLMVSLDTVSAGTLELDCPCPREDLLCNAASLILR